MSLIYHRHREDAAQHDTCTIPSLVPILRGKSSKKFVAQTSCGTQDSEHSAEGSRQTTCPYVLSLRAKHSHASRSWKHVVERFSACARKGRHEELTR